MLSKALLTIVLFTGPLAAQADAPLQTFLDQTLTAALDKAHLPAVAALIQIDGKIAAEAALGVPCARSIRRRHDRRSLAHRVRYQGVHVHDDRAPG